MQPYHFHYKLYILLEFSEYTCILDKKLHYIAIMNYDWYLT